MIRILTDRHHHQLLESLYILFEDRGILGETELHVPVGMDWYDREFWNFERQWHGDAVARQYLLGVWPDQQPTDGVLLAADTRHPGRTIRGITLDRALDTRFDLVISSLPHNDEGLHRFAQQTGAVFGVQVGNEAQVSRWDLARFILSSATMPGLTDPGLWGRVITTGSGVPLTIYHQEFSLETFRHEWPPATKAIGSFIQCFAENTDYYAEFRDFIRTEPGFDWRVYGSYGSAPADEFASGNIDLVADVAEEMRRMRVIWHQKGWGDGFGHVVHAAFAVGRPVVGRARYYENRLAGPLWVDGVTSFDIDRRTKEETIGILRRLLEDDDFHRKVSESSARRFRQVVDFDADAQAVMQLFEGVLS